MLESQHRKIRTGVVMKTQIKSNKVSWSQAEVTVLVSLALVIGYFIGLLV